MRIFDVGAKDGPEVITDRVLTVPNVLSVLRLIALPIIWIDLLAGRFTRAFWVLAVFAGTDWFDGYLARRLDQTSRLGKLLDPISDRLMILVVGVSMVLAEVIPLWVVLVLLLRDVLVMGGGAVLLRRGEQPPAVTRTGKAATFGLLFAFPAFLLAVALGDGVEQPQPVIHAIAWITYVVNTGLYYVAAAQYVREVKRRSADVRAGAADERPPLD